MVPLPALEDTFVNDDRKKPVIYILNWTRGGEAAILWKMGSM
jgi:hypothetical protein